MNSLLSTSLQTKLDWNLLRTFLAVADTGSLTAAAILLETSQSTLSRQIAELEAAFGIALFERVARGLRLTTIGEALIDPARQMQAAAQNASLAVLGQSLEIRGTVRLTASEMTSAYILPKILANLRQSHPEIQIELLVSNRIENLLERQADIALRHTRPRQSGLLAKRVADVKIGAFAHTDYLKRVGGQIDLNRLSDYDWIGLDVSDLLLRGFKAAGFPVGRTFFAFRCDNEIVGWHIALAGFGIGFAPTHIASRWPQMQQVLPEQVLPKMPIWLVTHRELRNNARLRIVFDALAKGLCQMLV
jgi:DNA-binding transcriptional LysR family regulator